MKKIVLSATLLFFMRPSFCQSFMHGVGITVMGSTTGQGSNSDIGFGEGFTYFPRFNFLENEVLGVVTKLKSARNTALCALPSARAANSTPRKRPTASGSPTPTTKPPSPATRLPSSPWGCGSAPRCGGRSRRGRQFFCRQ